MEQKKKSLPKQLRTNQSITRSLIKHARARGIYTFFSRLKSGIPLYNSIHPLSLFFLRENEKARSFARHICTKRGRTGQTEFLRCCKSCTWSRFSRIYSGQSNIAFVSVTLFFFCSYYKKRKLWGYIHTYTYTRGRYYWLIKHRL